MFDKVGIVSVFVSDQQRAKQFHTQKLGFELGLDAKLYSGAETRWIAVASKGAETELILSTPDENREDYKSVIGKTQAITLDGKGGKKFYGDLKAKGVKFANESDAQSWGTFVTMIDSEGNHILLVEQLSN